MGNCWNSNQGSLQRHASTWPPCTPIPHSSLLHAPSATSFQQISQNCIYLFPFLCPWLPYTHPDGYKREQWGCSMWLGLVLWIQHSCLSSSLFLKLKPWTVASANHAWLSRARNTRTNRVKTFRCSCKPFIKSERRNMSVNNIKTLNSLMFFPKVSTNAIYKYTHSGLQK